MEHFAEDLDTSEQSVTASEIALEEWHGPRRVSTGSGKCSPLAFVDMRTIDVRNDSRHVTEDKTDYTWC